MSAAVDQCSASGSSDVLPTVGASGAVGEHTNSDGSTRWAGGRREPPVRVRRPAPPPVGGGCGTPVPPGRGSVPLELGPSPAGREHPVRQRWGAVHAGRWGRGSPATGGNYSQ